MTSESSSAILAESTTTMPVSYLKSFQIFYSPLHAPLVVAICIFGTLCNSANICVLTRRNMKNSPTNVLLTGLSVAQLLLVINFLFYTLFLQLDENECVFWTKKYSSVVYLFLNVNLNVILHTIALVHTTALAFFRFLAIRFPSRSTWFSVRRAEITRSATYLTIPIACASFYFNSVIKEYTVSAGNCSLIGEDYMTIRTSKNITAYYIRYTSNTSLLTFNSWFFSTVCKLLPCACLTVLSVLLLYELRKLRERRQKFRRRVSFPTENSRDKSDQCPSTMSAHHHHQNPRDPTHNRVTIMLIIVVLLFVLVEAPQGVTYLLMGLKFNMKEVQGAFGDLFDVLTVFYSSVNFVIYCCMSGEFRKTFQEIFCSKNPHDSAPSNFYQNGRKNCENPKALVAMVPRSGYKSLL